MKVINFFGTTITLPGEPGVGIPDTPCRVERNGYQTTCWELSEEEIEEIRTTGKIWIAQLSQEIINPVVPSVKKPFFDV